MVCSHLDWTTPPDTPRGETISEYDLWFVVAIVFMVMGVVLAMFPVLFVVVKMLKKKLVKLGLNCSAWAKRMRHRRQTPVRRVRYDTSNGGFVVIEDENGVACYPEDIETGTSNTELE